METYFIHTPIGWLRLKGDENNLYEISFDPPVDPEPGNLLLKACADQIQAYFHGKLKKFDIPVSLSLTPFQEMVLSHVLAIPFGETRSYGQIADSMENPKSVRAIGNANGKNPLPIVIPCHRVVGSEGQLTGYSGGLWRKKWLLQHESSCLQLDLFPSFLS